jgi:hypothetical protein
MRNETLHQIWMGILTFSGIVGLGAVITLIVLPPPGKTHIVVRPVDRVVEKVVEKRVEVPVPIAARPAPPTRRDTRIPHPQPPRATTPVGTALHGSKECGNDPLCGLDVGMLR